MGATVAAGYVSLLCEVGEQYGIELATLLGAARLDAAALKVADAPIPLAALLDLLRFMLARTSDQALGLRIAHTFDLRKQGFWGYALLSSASLGERVEIHRRYQGLRSPAEFSMTVVGDKLVIDVTTPGVPDDLAPTILDWGFAGACMQHQKHLGPACAEVELWLDYRERPHHRELRALVNGPVVFEAPFNRLRMPAADLKQPLRGDPHLSRLATEQLDARLAPTRQAQVGDYPAAVRACLRARLATDASLERVAKDLGVSARTLRRQLRDAGTAFQSLLAEVRRARAKASLIETDDPVELLAAQLGYADPASFRRAFRRWTGLAPSAFRSKQRLSPAPIAVAADDRRWPIKSLPKRAV